VNCQRIQSLLSAYLDGELTGEEMIVIRSHTSKCEFCEDELKSLQIVKKLLGSLHAAEAKEEWSSTITTYAYSGGKPWWEKTMSAESFFIQFGSVSGSTELTPRGTRMVRALALSAVFVFLAAGPFATNEHLIRSATGGVSSNIDAVPEALTSAKHLAMGPMSSLFQTPSAAMFSNPPTNQAVRYQIQPSPILPTFNEPNWSSQNALTFVSDDSK
jgi:hypothetical protein